MFNLSRFNLKETYLCSICFSSQKFFKEINFEIPHQFFRHKEFIKRAFFLKKYFGKINPFFIAYKLKITLICAQEICTFVSESPFFSRKVK
jgi:hypothetical protein